MSYLYNFIPDFFSIPERSKELAENFVRHTKDPVSFLLYMEDSMSRRVRRKMKKLNTAEHKEKEE